MMGELAGIGWELAGKEAPVLQHAGLDCGVGKQLLEGGQCVAVTDAERQHLSKFLQ
jgi:hypothetical protein